MKKEWDGADRSKSLSRIQCPQKLLMLKMNVKFTD